MEMREKNTHSQHWIIIDVQTLYYHSLKNQQVFERNIGFYRRKSSIHFFFLLKTQRQKKLMIDEDKKGEK